MEVEEPAAEAGFSGFFGGVVLAFGELDTGFLGHGADSFGEAQIFYLADKTEDIAALAAAEAVVKLAPGVDGKRRGLLFVKRAEAAVVLGSGFAEANVAADDLYDIGLLFDGLGEVGHWFSGGCEGFSGASSE
jgi:hypothetical protein